MSTARKKHSCHNGLKLLPAQFLVLFKPDFLSSKSRNNGFHALRAQKSYSNSMKNLAGSNFKPLWQECFFSVDLKL
jgi:hypothetical protein